MNVRVEDYQLPDDVVAKMAKDKCANWFLPRINWAWVVKASLLPGKALPVALAIQFIAAMEKTASVAVRPSVLRSMGVDRHSQYRAIRKLEKARLIEVTRQRGRAARVTIVDPP